jgi:hypothetical protein
MLIKGKMRVEDGVGIISIIVCLNMSAYMHIHTHTQACKMDVIHPLNFLLSALTGAVAILLLLAVALLCAYELCAVYVTASSRASERYSPSGFFFGVSAIALAINMLFICRMVFNGKPCNFLILMLVSSFT